MATANKKRKAPTSEPAGKKIKLSTFLKWNFENIFNYETETADDGMTYVTKILCKMCVKHITSVERDDKMRGIVKSSMRTYVDGTTFITKHNLNRHINGKAHLLSLEYERMLGTSANDPKVGTSKFNPHQPRIDDALHRQAYGAYRKLLKTCYEIAKDGLPLSSLKTLVKVQKANGVQLIDGTDSCKACSQMVATIADVIRDKLAVLLCTATAFSIMTDGSQPKKTGSEKELILIRLEECGLPVYYVIGLEDMDSYGDASAANLKMAIDSAFKKLKIPEERYLKVMVGATSDGASVNTGCYNGLLTRLKNEREWIVTIHCVSHRLELSIQDSLMAEPKFTEVKKFMTDLYYTMKRSKLKSNLKAFGDVHNVTVYTHPKVHGTRFLAHQRAGVDALLNNWVPLSLTIENMCAGGKNRNAKLPGILKKLRSYDFLSTACLYKGLLDAVTPMSLKFQEGNLFLFDIVYQVECAKSHVSDLLSDNYSTEGQDPVECYCKRGPSNEPSLRCNGSELIAQLPKKGHMLRKEENQECVQLIMTGMTYTGGATKTHMTSLRDRVIPKILASIDRRLLVRLDSHLNDDDEVVKYMKWVDPANWVDDLNTEVDSMLSVAQKFKITLEYNKFVFDRKQIKAEWRDLKLTVKHYYDGQSAKTVWQHIIKFKKSQFPNIVKLVQIIYSLGPSNAFVEAGFSKLNSMLNDKRLKLKHATMENLFLIRANAKQLDENEILDSAVDKYMSKRRKLKLAQTQKEGDTNVMSGESDSSDEEFSDDESEEENEKEGQETEQQDKQETHDNEMNKSMSDDFDLGQDENDSTGPNVAENIISDEESSESDVEMIQIENDNDNESQISDTESSDNQSKTNDTDIDNEP